MYLNTNRWILSVYNVRINCVRLICHPLVNQFYHYYNIETLKTSPHLNIIWLKYVLFNELKQLNKLIVSEKHLVTSISKYHDLSESICISTHEYTNTIGVSNLVVTLMTLHDMTLMMSLWRHQDFPVGLASTSY